MEAGGERAGHDMNGGPPSHGTGVAQVYSARALQHNVCFSTPSKATFVQDTVYTKGIKHDNRVGY